MSENNISKSSLTLTMPTLAVVVVNFNAGDMLQECISALIACQEVIGNIDIIVVDNCSSDPSLSHLKTHSSYPHIKLIENNQNLGFAKACNQGLALAQTDYVLFLNPDCIVTTDAVQELRNAASDYPEIAMFGPCVLDRANLNGDNISRANISRANINRDNLEGKEQAGARRYLPTPKRLWGQILGLNRVFPDEFNINLHQTPLPSEPCEVEAISGSCMFARTEVFKRLGAWDEGYFMHWEDLDVCMRFRQIGERIMFLPTVKVWHEKGVSSRSSPLSVLWHKHHSMVYFFQKFFQHHPLPSRLALYALVYLRFFILASFSIAKKALSPKA